VTREHPATGADEFLVFDFHGEPDFAAVVPGGGIEEGESVDETAVREVKEETGLDVVYLHTLGTIERSHYVQATPAGPTHEAWEHHRPEGDVVLCRWVPVTADAKVWGLRGAFLHALVRKRVVAYVTRERDGLHELLVFDHKSMPDVPTQVPAGRIDTHESLEEGVRREVEEETGLTGIRVAGELADADEFERLYGPGAHRSWAFHAVADGADQDSWEHLVSGTGMDSGLVFVCRWVPLDDCPPLWGEPDPLVERLRRSISHP
jgi:8-oxo-dGTP pyrophosphatase MutT (NUDIX family)